MKSLETLVNRGISLNGIDYEGGLYLNPESKTTVDVATKVKDRILALASAQTNLAPNPADNEALAKDKAEAYSTVRKALDGDKEALASLNALRLDQVDNYVKAASNFLSFYEVVTLGDADEPGYENTSMNEIYVGYTGQDGSPRSVKVEPNQAHTRIPLRFLTTKDVGYYTMDLYKGNIAASALATFDLAFDMTFRVDREGYNLLTATVANGGAFGTFTNTGARASRVYVPHSGIVTAHLPTTNDISVKTDAIDTDGNYNTGNLAGRFGVRCLQETIRYADSWGGVFPDGRLVPTGEIIVPASDLFAILLDLTVVSTSGGRPNVTDIEKQVATQGYTSLSYGNREWKFIPDVTIVSGKCYPRFNKSIGKFFFKPGLDSEFVDTDRKKHYEKRSQQKVVGAVIYNQKRMNVAQLTYK